jgi:hypothetical protein
MTSMTFQRRIVAATIALACCGAAVPLAQKRGSNLFTDPSHRYSIEFPKDWNWMIVEGASEAISAFYHPKREAAIVVERFRMKQVLAQGEITDVFAQIETDVLKENQPRASEVDARVITQGPKRLVQIDYKRPGIGEPGKSEDQRVRQFSFPIGGNLYRITCFANASQFNRYESTCQWAAESLKSAEELASK